jgi:hypothetical protein
MWWVELLNSFAAILDSGGAGGAGGAFESIATITLGSTGTVSFTSIPSTYASLQLRILSKGGNDDRWKFNNDAGSNYSYHHLLGDGSTVSAGGTANAGGAMLGVSFGTGNYVSFAVSDIHDYASTTKFKTVRTIYGWDSNGVYSQEIRLRSSLWRNTNAITSITSLDTFAAGSVFSLYGIKGA